MSRSAFAVLVLLCVLPTTRADDDLNVLPTGPNDPPPRKMLDAYLQAQAKVHFEARRKAVTAARTPDEIQKRQVALKAAFREALGELPTEKSPLNAQVVGRTQKNGYSVENVIYESRPDHHVTANFYRPDGQGPFPGVLVPCGHSANGKAAEAYQRICISLARNGMAALCFDPIGQGERLQWLDPAGKSATGGGTTEHTLLGVGALLVGRSAAGYRVWDGIRSLDYLASRPEIDPARLGCTGNSGGGTETAYLMALDDRIVAAAPSCYITSLERLFATIGPQDAEQNITGQVALGIDHADYVTMRAPKPTLLSVGTQDFFDIQGSWDTFQEVKRIYCALRHGERVDLFESDEPHGFTAPRRESAMRWLRRWLLDKDDNPPEPETTIAADQELQCTKSGQVLSDFHDKSVFDFNAERAAELDTMRAERFAGLTAEELRDEVRKRLALRAVPDIIPLASIKKPSQFPRNDLIVQKWPTETEDGMVVPMLYFTMSRPASVERKPTIVYVGTDRSLADRGGPIERLVAGGADVVLIEPRGMGETAPGDRPGATGVDTREAFLSLHLDRPLLGQRVYDVLWVLTVLSLTAKPHGIELIGVGQGGPIVLQAMAMDERVKGATLERSSLSWSAGVRNPAKRASLADVVPGVLQSYDLPDLTAAIAPRRLTIREPLDPSGKPVSQEVLDAAYALARAAYKAAGAEEKLILQAGHQ